MMTSAYSELYLDDAMHNLGDMVEYAVCGLGFEPDEFFDWFLSSGVADRFGKGNPKYVSGMSGYELTEAVLNAIGVPYEKCRPSCAEFKEEPQDIDFKGREYWAGWILAYYQWKTCRRFEDMVEYGLPLSMVLSMYILHEADESKFVEAADEIIVRNKAKRRTKLSEIRMARGFTQQRLSEVSGVTLRMIQLYEQRQNDIDKAQAHVVLKLAKALGCRVGDLIE